MPDTGQLTYLQAEGSWPRLDRFLVAHLDGLSRTRIQAMIRSGRVSVDGETALKARDELSGGEQISIDLATIEPAGSLLPEEMDLDILHEDDQIVMINKPAGLITHPGAGVHSGTLANGLAARFEALPARGGALRPGIVHRLDKYTSGIMVVAKTDSAHADLARQFEQRQVAKTYRALVWGVPNKVGEIDRPLARDPRNRVAFKVIDGGRPALTRYRVIESFEHFALLELKPRTGRTHQLRVHLTHLGHPVFGDSLYGGVRDSAHTTLGARPLAARLKKHLRRQALHAERLTFRHPGSGRNATYTAPLPHDFDAALAMLREALDAR